MGLSMEFFHWTGISVHKVRRGSLSISSSNEKRPLSSSSAGEQPDGKYNPPEQIVVSSGRSYSWCWIVPDEAASWLKSFIRKSQL